MFLGTQANGINEYRGSSAIYIFMNGEGLLLDCGEGTYGQLYDHFGGNIQKILINTRIIFICGKNCNVKSKEFCLCFIFRSISKRLNGTFYLVQCRVSQNIFGNFFWEIIWKTTSHTV